MELIEKALQLALATHIDQKDKSGEAYILHPLRLMGKMASEEEKAVALLHDVIEDSEHTQNSLLKAGIPEKVVAAVLALTKNEEESYEDFIQRAKANELSRKVKIADLEDNINVLRLRELGPKDWERIKKYHSAWNELRNL